MLDNPSRSPLAWRGFLSALGAVPPLQAVRPARHRSGGEPHAAAAAGPPHGRSVPVLRLPHQVWVSSMDSHAVQRDGTVMRHCIHVTVQFIDGTVKPSFHWTRPTGRDAVGAGLGHVRCLMEREGVFTCCSPRSSPLAAVQGEE